MAVFTFSLLFFCFAAVLGDVCFHGKVCPSSAVDKGFALLPISQATFDNPAVRVKLGSPTSYTLTGVAGFRPVATRLCCFSSNFLDPGVTFFTHSGACGSSASNVGTGLFVGSAPMPATPNTPTANHAPFGDGNTARAWYSGVLCLLNQRIDAKSTQIIGFQSDGVNVVGTAPCSWNSATTVSMVAIDSASTFLTFSSSSSLLPAEWRYFASNLVYFSPPEICIFAAIPTGGNPTCPSGFTAVGNTGIMLKKDQMWFYEKWCRLGGLASTTEYTHGGYPVIWCHPTICCGPTTLSIPAPSAVLTKYGGNCPSGWSTLVRPIRTVGSPGDVSILDKSYVSGAWDFAYMNVCYLTVSTALTGSDFIMMTRTNTLATFQAGYPPPQFVGQTGLIGDNVAGGTYPAMTQRAGPAGGVYSGTWTWYHPYLLWYPKQVADVDSDPSGLEDLDELKLEA